MALKTERFEMRLDEDILDRVDKWRAQQGDVPSRAEAMRRLVELGLKRESNDTVRFSDGEKLLAFMMCDLYKHLKVGKDGIDPDFVSEVIVGGHYWAPKWALPGLYHNFEDDPDAVRLVVDILDMWSFIETGYEKLSMEDKAFVEKEAAPFGTHVQFVGFDGNNEAPLMGIARFLIEKMGRFEEFSGRNLNAHMPTIASYRRMLSVFAPIRETLVGIELNAGQIVALLKAKMRPE